ncbi:MAG TPA: xanthine dehydrogenase family protein subunit M, partial [Streptomyces sp.]
APAGDAVYLSAVDAELAAARPLRDNAFKVALARHLAVDALAALTTRA